MKKRKMTPEDFAKMLENKLIAKFGYNKKITLADMHRNFDDDLKFVPLKKAEINKSKLINLYIYVYI